jgi:hypothetical protein
MTDQRINCVFRSKSYGERGNQEQGQDDQRGRGYETRDTSRTVELETTILEARNK